MAHTYVSKTPNSDGIISYTDQENSTWSTLIKRQRHIIKDRACSEYLEGVELLQLSDERIPQIPEVNKVLNARTGWSAWPVDAVIPAEVFFGLLADKKFPVATFIRIPEELDYLEEPDIFHEVFGHCPLLTHQAYGDYMEYYGKLALTADKKVRARLFRLFWFTIEFGLMRQANGEYRIYGGGILSSKEETVFAVDSAAPLRVALDPLEAMRTPFRIDILQPKYFSIESLDELFALTKLDLIDVANQAIELGNLEELFDRAAPGTTAVRKCMEIVRLDDAQIINELKNLDGWQYDAKTKVIFRDYEFKGFLKTMSFVNAVAWHCNALNHHPDLEVGFKHCKVNLTTHDADGITERDIKTAKAVNDLLS